MRNTKTISISLPPEILKQAERVAKKEGRTKSELVREALRRYIQAREWEELNSYGRVRARELGIGEEDIDRIIHEYRTERRVQKKRQAAR